MGQKSIVFADERDGQYDVLFMMDTTDSRYGTENYRPITGGRYCSLLHIFEGANGHSYRIFGDGSARDLTTERLVNLALTAIARRVA